MANEIMDSLETSISYYSHDTFKNKKLVEHTIAIEKLISSTKRNMFEIATRLLVIRNENLFEDDNFKDVFDYASKVLGYKNSMVYKLITTAEKFIEQSEDKRYNSIIAHETEDYTVSQLIELNSIEPDEAIKLDEQEVISPNMTTKQIRERVKAYKNGEIDEYEGCIDEKTETEHEKEVVDETALLIIETIDNISKILVDERIIKESLTVSKLQEIKQFLNNLSL